MLGPILETLIGGLLTGAALVSVGTGGIAVGLASPTTSAETVEAVVSTQLAAAILRVLGILAEPKRATATAELRNIVTTRRR